jgi:hypothetical protein
LLGFCTVVHYDSLGVEPGARRSTLADVAPACTAAAFARVSNAFDLALSYARVFHDTCGRADPHVERNAAYASMVAS